MAAKTRSTRQVRLVHRATAVGLTITPKPSEIHGIPLEGGLAYWQGDAWWTVGAMRASNLPLDLNGILGMFRKKSGEWAVRVWTASETLRALSNISACGPRE